MKKLLLRVLVLMSSGTLFALPVGNPAEVEIFTNGLWTEGAGCDFCDPCFCWNNAWHMRIGFHGSYVFNRHMQVDNKSGGSIDRTEIYTNAGRLVLNLCNRGEVFTTLGVTNLAFRSDLSSFTAPSLEIVDVVFSPNFSWSVGGKAAIWRCNCFTLGIEGEYFRTTPSFNYILEEQTGAFTYVNGRKAAYSEWQIAVAASYRFMMKCSGLGMVPYVGVSWAESHLNTKQLNVTLNGINTAVTLDSLRSQKLWGYVVGTTFILGNEIGVTVEGHFADQQALYVNGQFRF